MGEYSSDCDRATKKLRFKMSKIETQNPYKWTNVWNQYYATFAANFIMFAQGCIMGWIAPAISKLSSENTPLVSGPLTNAQISWIGSINCLGGLIGATTVGFFVSFMGSKRTLLCLTIPSTAFWLLIYFGNTYNHVLLARFTGGISGMGIQTCALLFISEIANDDIRGRLGSVMFLFRHIGILVAYVLGATLHYRQIPFICVFFPIIFGMIFIMLPNTPQFFLRKGQFQKAENALMYYKGYKGKSDKEDIAFGNEFERIIALANESKVDEKLEISDFFNRAALKGLGIGFALAIIAQLPANFILINYAVMIFEKVGQSVDPYISSIILAVALILGSLATTYLADILGRRVLNLVSLLGSAIGLLAMSLYYYLYVNGYDLSAFSWVPVISLSFVIFISSAGIVTLACVCSVENLPTKIRTPGYVIINLTVGLSAFATVKLFPILLQIIDLHGCMLFLGVGCILSSAFVYFVLKETSGQSIDDVDTEEKIETETNSKC